MKKSSIRRAFFFKLRALFGISKKPEYGHMFFEIETNKLKKLMKKRKTTGTEKNGSQKTGTYKILHENLLDSHIPDSHIP